MQIKQSTYDMLIDELSRCCRVNVSTFGKSGLLFVLLRSKANLTPTLHYYCLKFMKIILSI